jgi:AraC-like DNA-binding protein
MKQRTQADHYQADVTREDGWQRRALIPELGQCYTDRIALEPGLNVAYSYYQPTKDLVEESIVEKDTSTLSLTFGLSGRSYFRGQTFNADQFVFEPNHSTMTTFGNSVGERVYSAGDCVEQLRIIVDGRLFEHYQIPFSANADALKRPQKQDHRPTTPSTDYLVRRLLLLSKSARNARPLEKHILTFTLLSEQLALLPNNTERSSGNLDEEKLHKAKTFMLANMEQRLSVAFIAHQVGLSETKLHNGFKALFDQSPYQFLLSARMQKAWELLQSGYQVSQAAYAVGYEHPSNFSAAFRQFFGHSPKAISSRS